MLRTVKTRICFLHENICHPPFRVLIYIVINLYSQGYKYTRMTEITIYNVERAVSIYNIQMALQVFELQSGHTRMTEITIYNVQTALTAKVGKQEL